MRMSPRRRDLATRESRVFRFQSEIGEKRVLLGRQYSPPRFRELNNGAFSHADFRSLVCNQHWPCRGSRQQTKVGVGKICDSPAALGTSRQHMIEHQLPAVNARGMMAFHPLRPFKMLWHYEFSTFTQRIAILGESSPFTAMSQRRRGLLPFLRIGTLDCGVADGVSVPGAYPVCMHQLAGWVDA